MWRLLGRDVLLCLLSEVLGCTVAAVSAHRPMRHVNHALQNIMTDWTPHNVCGTLSYSAVPNQKSRAFNSGDIVFDMEPGASP